MTPANYRENPKTAGSGILCCIPQIGACPAGCEDCFFQSGRSYLEPLEENLPNMPPPSGRCIVRVNDGNDSNVCRSRAIDMTTCYSQRFFNTSIAKGLDDFPAPIVLTVNPGTMTDRAAQLIESIPVNLMFVRFRTTAWNLDLCDRVVRYYTSREVPVILTFMAFFETAHKIPEDCRRDYVYRKRTLNSYWAIKTSMWLEIMGRYNNNVWVHSCGSEGIPNGFACRHCGNCLREYFATTERLDKAAAPGGIESDVEGP